MIVTSIMPAHRSCATTCVQQANCYCSKVNLKGSSSPVPPRPSSSTSFSNTWTSRLMCRPQPSSDCTDAYSADAPPRPCLRAPVALPPPLRSRANCVCVARLRWARRANPASSLLAALPVQPLSQKTKLLPKSEASDLPTGLKC